MMYCGTYKIGNVISFPIYSENLNEIIDKLINKMVAAVKPKEEAEWVIYDGKPGGLRIGTGGITSDGKDWCEFF